MMMSQTRRQAHVGLRVVGATAAAATTIAIIPIKMMVIFHPAVAVDTSDLCQWTQLRQCFSDIESVLLARIELETESAFQLEVQWLACCHCHWSASWWLPLAVERMMATGTAASQAAIITSSSYVFIAIMMSVMMVMVAMIMAHRTVFAAAARTRLQCLLRLLLPRPLNLKARSSFDEISTYY